MKLNKTFGNTPYNISQNVPFRCVTVVPELSMTTPSEKSTFSEFSHLFFFTHISVFMLFHKQFFSIQTQGTIVNNSYTTKYVNKHTTKNNIFIKESLIVASTELPPKIYWHTQHLITHFQQTPWNIYLLHQKWVWQTTVWKLCISGTFWEPVQM